MSFWDYTPFGIMNKAAKKYTPAGMAGLPNPWGMSNQAFDSAMPGMQGPATPGVPGVTPPDYSLFAGQIDKATDPSFLNSLFNIGAGNLSQMGAQQAALARQRAGAQASSRGLLNPSAFVNATGAQAQAPFTAGIAGLEGKRAEALQSNEAQKANLLFLLEQARHGGAMDVEKLRLALQQLALQRDAQTAGLEDYLGQLFGIGAKAAPFLV